MYTKSFMHLANFVCNIFNSYVVKTSFCAIYNNASDLLVLTSTPRCHDFLTYSITSVG